MSGKRIDKTLKWYKTINRKGWQVFNFSELTKETYQFIIIITERGQGKTFNMLDFMRDEYLASGKKSVFAYNTIEQFKTSKNRFLREHQRINPHKWEQVKMTKEGVYDEETQEVFIYFAALSSPAKFKGARVECQYFCLDEFNEGCQLFRNHQTANLMSLIMTFSNPTNPKSMKVFIFGNHKTLGASQLLPKLGITSLRREITIWGDSQYLLWIPKPKNIELSKLHNKWLVDLSHKLESGFSFYNSAIDNYCGVKSVSDVLIIQKTWRKGEVFWLNGCYYQEYQKEDDIILVNVKEVPQNIQLWTFRSMDIKEGVIFSNQVRFNFLDRLAARRLWFDSQLTKNVVFSCLT